MKRKRLSILPCLVLAISACSTVNQGFSNALLQNASEIEPLDLKIGDAPTAPSDIAFPIASDGLPAVDFVEENNTAENAIPSTNPLLSLTESPQTLVLKSSPVTVAAVQNLPPRPEPSDASNYVSIMGQNGRVITVWALARGNWLWAYASFESQDFGNIRNWKLEPSFSREHFRFINQQLGSCMQAYKNGLIHADCDPRNLAQDFELLPSNTGSVFIKSVSANQCITYNPVSNTGYSTLTLSPCTDQISPLKDQNFYIAPPILKATPQN